jgi:hypothetical protein
MEPPMWLIVESVEFGTTCPRVTYFKQTRIVQLKNFSFGLSLDSTIYRTWYCYTSLSDLRTLL